MATKVLPLCGEYNREGARLTREDGTGLIITHRKQNPKRPNKAENFLLYVSSSGEKVYVSSLWETSTTGIYKLEYNGQRYTLNTTPTGKAEVIQVNHPNHK